MQQCVIQQYIDFLEKHSIDRHFYCRAGESASWNEWELYWKHRRNEECCWGVKRVSDREWRWFSGRDVLGVLKAVGVDVSVIEAEMHATIKSMIVYSNLMIEDSKNLLGEHIVAEAMTEYHAFSDVLVSTIRAYVPVMEANKSKAKQRQKAFLRVVT